MLKQNTNTIADQFGTMPPVDAEAERWVIGSILISPALLDDLPGLQAVDFYDTVNAAIVKEILELHATGQPVHVEILKKHLGNEDWAARTAEIAAAVPVASHVHHYHEIVRTKAALRRLRTVGEDLFDATRSPKASPEAILERSEVALSRIRMGNDESEPITLVGDFGSVKPRRQNPTTRPIGRRPDWIA